MPAEVLDEGEADGGLVVDDQQPPGSSRSRSRGEHEPCQAPSPADGPGPTALDRKGLRHAGLAADRG